MISVSFVEMTEEYLNEVLEIYAYYVLNTTATFHMNVPTKDEMHSMVFFNNLRYRTFVIKSQNGICGYVLLTSFKKREAYNDAAEVTIYLKPDFTGMGIGSRAVQYIEEFAKEQQIHVLISTICGENLESIRLFEKNGYFKCVHMKEVGKKFGKRLDLVIFQKII